MSGRGRRTTGLRYNCERAYNVDEFECDNGYCVDDDDVCDGNDDCRDGSDEENCGNYTHMFYLSACIQCI